MRWLSTDAITSAPNVCTVVTTAANTSELRSALRNRSSRNSWA